MAMTECRLRPDFIQFMDDRKAWPLTKNLVKWMREHHGGIKSGRYAQLKHGEATDPRYVVGLVRFLLFALDKNRADEQALAFVEYVRSLGIEQIDQVSEATLAQRLLDQEDVDYIKRGVSGLLDALLQKRRFLKTVSACQTDVQVAAAVRWMFAWVGRQIRPQADRLPIDEAMRAAEAHMRTTIDAYTARALAWSAYDRWTLVMARSKRMATGVSIVLPLREDAYEELKRGHRMSYDIRPHELHRPSRQLLIEALAERPPELFGATGNTTKHTLKAVVTQLAILSRCRGEEANQKLRLLTFGGAPLSRERAIGFGFKPVGTTMGDTGLEFYEKTLAWPFSSQDLILMGLMAAIGQWGDYLLAPPRGDEP